jgi:hypothetical protein
MNTYKETSPTGEVTEFTSKISTYTHSVFAAIDYGTGDSKIRCAGRASSKQLAEKKASSLISKCSKNGFFAKTWIVTLEVVA